MYNLIDSDRVYKIMQKIKILAKKQLEQGSRGIDYAEIVKYLKDKDNGFTDLQDASANAA